MEHFLVMEVFETIKDLEHDALHLLLIKLHLLSVNQMKQIVITLLINEP